MPTRPLPKLEKLTSETRLEWFILFRAFMIRTMAASISCFLSSSTLLRVSFLSGSDSPLAVTACILTRCNLDVKESLTENIWAGSANKRRES